MHKGIVNVTSDMDILFGEKPQEERMDLVVTEPAQIAKDKIQAAIASALRPWFYEAEDFVDEIAVQAAIDQWFANSDDWRVLKSSRIAQEDQQNGIIIDIASPDPSHRSRMMSRIFNEKLHGSLDLNSTSIGNKVNECFRLADGAQISREKIVASSNGNPFSKILTKHAIGLGMNPRRAYLIRTTMEGAIDLVQPESPLVTPYDEQEENPLHGINYDTAIMHLDVFTHEDGIAISESAAQKMAGARISAQLVESHLPVTPLVKEGDQVTPETPVALDGKKQVTASKLYYPGIVLKAESQRGSRLGEETYRFWLQYESYYPLETGDKLSNRHGGKGVVTVLPDSQMPHHHDGTPVEICIGPETITNRKAMSILWEMMLGKKAQQDGKSIQVKLFNSDQNLDWNRDELHNFEALAEEFGDKEQLYLNNQPLDEETFVGPLFWLRLDKIAREIVNSTNRRGPKNNLGGTVDQAKLSGQRCNISKIMALFARNLDHTALEIVEENMSAEKHFCNIVNAIRNYEHVDAPMLRSDN